LESIKRERPDVFETQSIVDLLDTKKRKELKDEITRNVKFISVKTGFDVDIVQAVVNEGGSSQDSKIPAILDHSRQVLSVKLHRNGDSRSDVTRLEAVLISLRKFQGNTPFNVTLTNSSGQNMTIEFPNDTTRDCKELRLELAALLGPEAIE